MRIFIFGLTVCCFLSAAEAEPLPAPSFDALCAETKNVIVVEYQSYKPPELVHTSSELGPINQNSELAELALSPKLVISFSEGKLIFRKSK